MDSLADVLKANGLVYLSSAALVVVLLSWMAKWLGLMANGGSTPVEVIVFCVALPCFLRECFLRLDDEGPV